MYSQRRAEVVFACERGEAAGFALFFHNFSTFLGKPGLYLEDLFISPEHRGKSEARKTHPTIDQQIAAADATAGGSEFHLLHLNAQ